MWLDVVGRSQDDSSISRLAGRAGQCCSKPSPQAAVGFLSRVTLLTGRSERQRPVGQRTGCSCPLTASLWAWRVCRTVERALRVAPSIDRVLRSAANTAQCRAGSGGWGGASQLGSAAGAILSDPCAICHRVIGYIVQGIRQTPSAMAARAGIQRKRVRLARHSLFVAHSTPLPYMGCHVEAAAPFIECSCSLLSASSAAAHVVVRE